MPLVMTLPRIFGLISVRHSGSVGRAEVIDLE